MKIDSRNYRLENRIFYGDNLRLLFQNKEQEKDIKVLEMKAVAGFFDHVERTDNLIWIRIDEPGGSYNFDLAMRLKNPHIEKHLEVFIFTDVNCVNFCFRCSAESAVFRDWTQNDKWLK